MKATITTKRLTDKLGAVAHAALYGENLQQVAIVNPIVDAADPNTVSPNASRVLAWPAFSDRLTRTVAFNILGGTSLSGRFWLYDTPSGKWIPTGNIFTATNTGPASTTIGSGGFTKKLYLQITAVSGPVTDLTYGWTA